MCSNSTTKSLQPTQMWCHRCRKLVCIVSKHKTHVSMQTSHGCCTSIKLRVERAICKRPTNQYVPICQFRKMYSPLKHFSWSATSITHSLHSHSSSLLTPATPDAIRSDKVLSCFGWQVRRLVQECASGLFLPEEDYATCRSMCPAVSCIIPGLV